MCRAVLSSLDLMPFSHLLMACLFSISSECRMEQKNDVYIVQMSVTCVTVVVQQNINDSSPTEK